MKPSRSQYFFAQRWPTGLLMLAIPLLVVYWVYVGYKTSFEPLIWGNLVVFTFLLLLTLLLGFLVGILFMGLFVGAIYHARGEMNGGPFRKGDLVRILCGPHRDRIVRVYSTWQG